jgi:hypothetical protein
MLKRRKQHQLRAGTQRGLRSCAARECMADAPTSASLGRAPYRPGMILDVMEGRRVVGKIGFPAHLQRPPAGGAAGNQAELYVVHSPPGPSSAEAWITTGAGPINERLAK